MPPIPIPYDVEGSDDDWEGDNAFSDDDPSDDGNPSDAVDDESEGSDHPRRKKLSQGKIN